MSWRDAVAKQREARTHDDRAKECDTMSEPKIEKRPQLTLNWMTPLSTTMAEAGTIGKFNAPMGRWEFTPELWVSISNSVLKSHWFHWINVCTICDAPLLGQSLAFIKGWCRGHAPTTDETVTDLRAEVERLAARVTELQGANTREVTERRRIAGMEYLRTVELEQAKADVERAELESAEWAQRAEVAEGLLMAVRKAMLPEDYVLLSPSADFRFERKRSANDHLPGMPNGDRRASRNP